MLQLIKKDLLFNWKWALFVVVVPVLISAACRVSHETRVILFVYILGTVLANAHFVSKSCYLDDNPQTRRFLAALPVTGTERVASKYVLGLMCAAVSIAVASLASLVFGLTPTLRGALFACVYLLLYYAVFLGVFYRSNYSGAEKANAAFQMLTVMSLFVIDRSGLLLDEMPLPPAVLPAMLGISAALFAASMGSSIKASTRFQSAEG